MTPQELKNSIIQLAVQGKLVEQRLGECSTYAASKEKISSSAISAEMWSLDLEDIEKETGRITNYCCASERKITGDKVIFHKGQILYSKLRPYLKKILVAPNDGICTPELVPFNMIGDFDSGYIAYVLKAPHIDFAINSVTYGVKMPRVGTDTMVNLLIPVPPLAEQHRIVAKIEELLPLIDRYEKAYTRLEDFNKRFPVDMQKSILQMAIQGKLVEQRAEEGTGEELYQQIQKEKAALIKAGKIKKEKPLADITDEEIPFEIPDSWRWVRLSELSENIGDGIHGTPIFNTEGDYYFINGNNLNNGIITIKADTQKVDFEEYKKYKKPLTLNTVFISINGTIGNIAYYNGEPIILGKSACYISLVEPLYRNYIRVLLESDFFLKYAFKEATQTTIKNVSLKAIRMLPVPLPPLAEQKRIVAKLDELLPLCDRLK